MAEYNAEAVQKLVSFLQTANGEHLNKMHLIMRPVRPILAYKNNDWFVAMDPYNGQFFIDEDLNFPFQYDFHSDRNLHLKVDEWGKTLLDKARKEALANWMRVTTF